MAGTARTGHSRLGLLSFWLAVLCGGGILCLLALLWLAGRWVAESGVEPDAPGLGLMVLFFMLTGIFFLLVAFVLGIAGMLRRRRRGSTRSWEPS
jgi:Na+/melibiose symporter-like transporter